MVFTDKKQSGFTMMELLVVVTIIIAVGVTMLFSINNSLKRSRDARRIAEIKQIQSALEMYYRTNGTLPNEVPQIAGWESSALSPNFLSSLAPFLSKIPVDPINTSNPPNADYWYGYHFYDEVANPGGAHGCNFDGQFAILAIRTLEATPESQRENAVCTTDWSADFDYSIIIR